MSPIIGLTDDLKPRFPRLGKLRKGGERVEKTNARGEKYTTFGEDLDHFRFTGEKAEITAAFYAHNEEQPAELRCFLAYPTPDEAFEVWAEIWGASGLVHRCDGVNMTVWLEGNKYVAGSKPCAGGHKDGDYKKDAVGRLNLILPELLMAGHVGYVTLETHSKNDIVHIMSVLLETYRKAYAGGGDLTGIEFVLRRVQETISAPGFGAQAGKRSTVKKWLVRIEPAAEWVRHQLEAAHAGQLAQLPETVPTNGNGHLNANPETGELIEDEPIEGESWEISTDATDYLATPPEEPPAETQSEQKPAQYRKASPPPAQKATSPGNGTRPANSKPTPLDWTKFVELCDQAEKLHIDVTKMQPPAGATLGALRSAYVNVQNAIKAKQARPAAAGTQPTA